MLGCSEVCCLTTNEQLLCTVVANCPDFASGARQECPGGLVESACLSNDAEARRVATPAFRQQIAAALAAAIRDYAATLDSLRPKTQPAPATPAPPPTSTPR